MCGVTIATITEASVTPTKLSRTQENHYLGCSTEGIRINDGNDNQPGMSYSSSDISPSSSTAILTPPLLSYQDVDIAVREWQSRHLDDFVMVDDTTYNATPRFAPRPLPEPKIDYLPATHDFDVGYEDSEMKMLQPDSLELQLLAFTVDEARRFQGVEEIEELERELEEAKRLLLEERGRIRSTLKISPLTREVLQEEGRRSCAPSPEVPPLPAPRLGAEAAAEDTVVWCESYKENLQESTDANIENISVARRLHRPASEGLIWGFADDLAVHLHLGGTNEVDILSDTVLGLQLSNIAPPSGSITFSDAFIHLEDYEDLKHQLGLDNDEGGGDDDKTEPTESLEAPATPTPDMLAAAEQFLHAICSDTLRVYGASAIGIANDGEANGPLGNGAEEEGEEREEEEAALELEPVEDGQEDTLAELMRSTAISV